jgi:hypothetical protein
MTNNFNCYIYTKICFLIKETFESGEDMSKGVWSQFTHPQDFITSSIRFLYIFFLLVTFDGVLIT